MGFQIYDLWVSLENIGVVPAQNKNLYYLLTQTPPILRPTIRSQCTDSEEGREMMTWVIWLKETKHSVSNPGISWKLWLIVEKLEVEESDKIIIVFVDPKWSGELLRYFMRPSERKTAEDFIRKLRTFPAHDFLDHRNQPINFAPTHPLQDTPQAPDDENWMIGQKIIDFKKSSRLK